MNRNPVNRNSSVRQNDTPVVQYSSRLEPSALNRHERRARAKRVELAKRKAKNALPELGKRVDREMLRTAPDAPVVVSAPPTVTPVVPEPVALSALERMAAQIRERLGR